jgi:hypothetical protein
MLIVPLRASCVAEKECHGLRPAAPLQAACAVIGVGVQGEDLPAGRTFEIVLKDIFPGAGFLKLRPTGSRQTGRAFRPVGTQPKPSGCKDRAAVPYRLG